jgi:hypothetical protein
MFSKQNSGANQRDSSFLPLTVNELSRELLPPIVSAQPLISLVFFALAKHYKAGQFAGQFEFS